MGGPVQCLGGQDAVSSAPSSADLRSELSEPLQATSWREYLAGCTEDAAKVKDRESFALAALQALQSLPKDWRLEPIEGRCVVWVLGARDGIEKRQILVGGWERLFRAFDVGWDVVLVGPELQPDPYVHRKPGRAVYTYPCLLHEAQLETCLRQPSFICGFNTGIGACVAHHMRPWMPTLSQLLILKRPLLLTCFGIHEARMEDWVLTALHARFTKHEAGGFGHVIEADKPLSVCNAFFSWVCGSSATDVQVELSAVPYVDSQLRSAELLVFLKEVKSHLAILSDPDGAAHSGWAEMYDGRFVPCLKQALEEDDDGRGGVQTILRCTMKSLASACVSNREAAAVLADLGAAEVLPRFRAWAERDHWTPHQWMREEILERVREAERALAAIQGPSCIVDADGDEDIAEEPLSGGFTIRAEAPVVLRERPARQASVIASLGSGRTLRLRGRRRLWLRVAHGSIEGWLLAYEARASVGFLVAWDIKCWERP